MKIIKSCLINFYKNLKYYFVPLGISAFFLVIALYVAIPIVVNSIEETFTGIATVLGKMEFRWQDALQEIINKAMKIDYSSQSSVVDTVTNRDWILNTLKDVATALFGDEASSEAVMNMIKGCVATISAAITILVAMAVIGFVVAFFVIILAARRSLAKVSWWKAILFALIDTVLFAGFIVLYFLLGNMALWAKMLISFAYAIVLIVISLIEAYVFYGVKVLKIKETVQLKNMGLLLLGNLITLVLGIAVTLIPVIALPGYGGYILAIPFLEIVFLVIHMNEERYVRDLSVMKKEKKLAQAK